MFLILIVAVIPSTFKTVYFVLLILPVTVSYSEGRCDPASANVYFEVLVV